MKQKKSKQEIHRDIAKVITGFLPFLPAIFLMSLGMSWGVVVKQNYDGSIGADEYWLGIIIASFSAFLALGLYGKTRVSKFWEDRETNKEKSTLKKEIQEMNEKLEHIENLLKKLVAQKADEI